MSGHERERLSAYLDGELAAGERTLVEAHLAACPACAASLSDMGAVDAATAAAPVEAPEGYFETFAPRVVARLGAASRATARTRRLPAWTWAAAAALLLAVVAPLTLRQSAPGPAGRPPALVASPPAAARPAAPAVAGRQLPAAKSAENEAVSRDARKAPPPPAGPAQAGTFRSKWDNAPAQSAAREEPAVATTDVFAPPEGRAPAVAPAPTWSSARQGEAAAGAVSPPEADRSFERLEASRPRTSVEWRRLRDAWTAFAAAHPDDPRADEARVRAIEAGREAWLAAGAGDDESVFRRDARAYLEREDAPQKGRVERLLQLPARRP